MASTKIVNSHFEREKRFQQSLRPSHEAHNLIRLIVLIVAHHFGFSSRQSHALSQWRLTFV